MTPLCSISHSKTKSIFIRAAFEHRHALGARGLNYKVIPDTVGAGGSHHTITIPLLAILLGVDQKILEDIATGSPECLIQIDWGYGTTFPKFSTMHRLVAGASPTIALMGGSGWAQRLADIPSVPEPQQKVPLLSYPQWTPGLIADQGTKRSPFTFLAQTGQSIVPHRQSWLEIDLRNRDFSPQLQEKYSTASSTSEDDQLSVYSDSASTISTLSEATTPGDYIPGMFRQESSMIDTVINDDWMDRMIQQQFQDEAFQQRKRQADDLYNRTRDIGGLVAVMRTANQFSRGNITRDVPRGSDING